MTTLAIRPVFAGFREASGWRPHLILTALLCVGSIGWVYITSIGLQHWAIALILQAAALVGARVLGRKIQSTPAAVPAVSAETRLVLVVDDHDELLQRKMRSTFAEGGCSVTVAATSYEAVQFLRKNPTSRIPLVIVDVHIPALDSVVERSTRLEPRPVVALVSGHPDGQYTVRYVGTDQEKIVDTADDLVLALRGAIWSAS